MSLVPFDSLPDDARLWCFGVEPKPAAPRAGHLVEALKVFVESWTAHRRDLVAAVDLWHDRFLLVALDEGAAGASGCSIDALMGLLRELERSLELHLTDTSPVWYRDAEGQIRSSDRETFRRLAAEGSIGPGTKVFDLTITDLGTARATRLERPASDSWHSRLL